MPEIGDNRPKWLRVVQPFAAGGFAGCAATCFVQPIDMVKVRIQLAGEGATGGAANPFTIAREFVKKEGFTALYKGLDAGLLRQITYTTARMGMFRLFSDSMKTPGEPLPLWKKGIAGLTAGGLASFVGTPADLALIRLQADNTLPAAQRRHYKGAFDALVRVVKDEGLFTLWRGTGPTVARACAINLGMLTTYDQAKEMLQPRLGDGWGCKLTSSAVAGVGAVYLSYPFDFIKTRVQKMKADPTTGKYPYSGLVDCARKVTAKEGTLGLYRGVGTYYIRIAPHAMIVRR
eukprot:GHVU01167988.1.p1 GENE.GHVU01167988.1~~GHVU01167988.1.p1  ORF type:complete len:290 (+),score=40.41 GHVU01167988.1:266-1135(+)